MVETLGALSEALGEVSELLAHTGYFSEANVAACVEADIDPLIAHRLKTRRARVVWEAQADRGAGLRHSQRGRESGNF
jgi:hypothetical protein